MDVSLTVLWPENPAPEIEEVRFSYDFCRKMSQQLCEEANLTCSWIEYPGDPTLEEVLPRIKGDMVLVVTEPEILFSPSGVRGLLACAEEGYSACGPVYNETVYPDQRAALPVPYVDVETYLEVAESLAESENSKHIAVPSLDPACVLYRRDFLRQLPAGCPLSEIPQCISKLGTGRAAVSTGALVHWGFKKDFESDRDDLVRLVPKGVKRVLDIGCAMGGYGKTLKQLRPEVFLTGVEPNPIMAESALRYYDEVVRCPVEDADLPGDFDLINCGDILEHLEDPWRMLVRLHSLLRHGGCLVTSVPNVGHWSVVNGLLQGRFQYIPLGLLCVTHLRWFTESSIRRALEDAGFFVELLQREQITPTPLGLTFVRDMCAAGYGDEESLMTNEFIIRAVKK